MVAGVIRESRPCGLRPWNISVSGIRVPLFLAFSVDLGRPLEGTLWAGGRSPRDHVSSTPALFHKGPTCPQHFHGSARPATSRPTRGIVFDPPFSGRSSLLQNHSYFLPTRGYCSFSFFLIDQ